MAVIVGGFLPIQVGLLMGVATHAILIGGSFVHSTIENCHDQNADKQAHQSYDPVFTFASRHRGFS
jgi:hypothetical protein